MSNIKSFYLSLQVWSVRSCEGSLKKRGHCLVVNGLDARALTAPVAISGKLSVRRTPIEQLAHLPQPRAVLRVANRGNMRDTTRNNVRETTRANNMSQDLEPFLQDLQNDVARLSRAFATLGREADALVRSEAEMRARIENGSRNLEGAGRALVPPPVESPPIAQNNQPDNDRQLSRNARRRIRQRLRAALNAPQAPNERPTNVNRPNVQVSSSQMQNGLVNNPLHMVGLIVQQPPVPPPPVPPPQSSSGPSNGQSQNGQVRTNKKKRRQRR